MNQDNHLTDNRELNYTLVDETAEMLCVEYNNSDFRKWYCKVIMQLGVHRVRELVGICSDASDPAKLFSKRAKQEMKAKEGLERLNQLRRRW